MTDRCTPSRQAARISSLYLDYGADAMDCGEDTVEICERGMQLRSRWRFEIGMELSLSFVCGGDALNAGERFTAEASVVSCEPVPECEGLYHSTLLFIEVPDQMRASLQGVLTK